MKQKKNIFVQIWYVVYPLLFYYAVALIAMSLCQWLLGSDDEHFVMCQLVSTVITIPFMMPFYRSANYFDFSVVKSSDDQAKKKSSLPEGCIKNIIFSVIIVLCISFALNNLISMTPLVEWSKGYQQANAGFYGSTLGLEILSSAICTPILEEVVFRGILFGRIRGMMAKIPAVLVSALIFAALHFNVVQFIYAFLLGIVLALLMEKAGHVYAAVAGHMAANLLAVLRTELGLFSNMTDKSISAWVISVLMLVVGIVVLYWHLQKEKEA